MGVPADPVRRRAVETSRDARNRSRPVHLVLPAFILSVLDRNLSRAIRRAQSRELQQRLPEAMDKIDAWLGHRANGVLGILFNEESADTLRSAAAQRAARPTDSVLPPIANDSAPVLAITDSSSSDTLA